MNEKDGTMTNRLVSNSQGLGSFLGSATNFLQDFVQVT